MKVPGSGRRKGVPNKRTLHAIEIAQKLNCNPLEILIKFAMGDWKGLGYDSEVYHMATASGDVKAGFTITPQMRLQAAAEASRYLYSRPKETIELLTPQDQQQKDVIELTNIINESAIEKISS